MTDKKKLYVTKINKDDTCIIAGTNDYKKVLYNIHTIDNTALTLILDDIAVNNIGAFIEAVGQFICICNMSFDENFYSMTLLDFRNDYNKLTILADKMDDGANSKLITECYYQSRRNSEDFELTEEDLPPTNE